MCTMSSRLLVLRTGSRPVVLSVLRISDHPSSPRRRRKSVKLLVQAVQQTGAGVVMGGIAGIPGTSTS
jgi:hypothetical protein